MEMKVARKREEKSKVAQLYGMSSSDDDDDVGGSESNSEEGKRMSTLEEELRLKESESVKQSLKREKEKL